MLNLFKYFYQKIRQFLSKNVPILSDQNMSKVAKYVPRGQNVSIPPIYTLLMTPSKSMMICYYKNGCNKPDIIK